MIIDGKKVAQELREELKQTCARIKKESYVTPKLVVIQVGNNEASTRYVRNKQKACEEVGIESETVLLPEESSVLTIARTIAKYNMDDSVHGILLQLPLPDHISKEDSEWLSSLIIPEKDVDGFTIQNMGRVMKFDNSGLMPCTPAGIMYLLHKYNIQIAGKHCVIVGRSNIVSKPLAMMLLQEDATVTICHSKTRNLQAFTERADILVSATGKPNIITPFMVKKDAVVIDVGINMVDGKLCGDVDKKVADIASYITPVPGGVGPMTIAMLLQNTLKATGHDIN